MKPCSVGILGGSFDPVHKGHIELAKAARKALKLDSVILVPSYISPFKRNQKTAKPSQRVSMLKIIAKQFKWMRVSDFEVKRRGISYTVVTVKHFRKLFVPGCKIYYILGADSFIYFKKWKKYGEILKLVELAVALRPEIGKQDFPDLPYTMIPMKKQPIASRNIRRALLNNTKLVRGISKSVFAYIKKNNLYKRS